MNENNCLHPTTICSKITIKADEKNFITELVKQCVFCKKILERRLVQQNPIKNGGNMKYTLQEKMIDLLKTNRTEEFEELTKELRDFGYEVIHDAIPTITFLFNSNIIDIAGLNKILL